MFKAIENKEEIENKRFCVAFVPRKTEVQTKLHVNSVYGVGDLRVGVTSACVH